MRQIFLIVKFRFKNEVKSKQLESKNFLENILIKWKNFKRAALLLSPKIEKRVVIFKNPLIFRGYKYGKEAFFLSKTLRIFAI